MFHLDCLNKTRLDETVIDQNRLNYIYKGAGANT